MLIIWLDIFRSNIVVLNYSCRTDDDNADSAGDSSGELMEEGKHALKRFMCELCGHQNFLWFTAMNLVQV